MKDNRFKIVLDEQIKLNGNYWIFERSNWKGYIRAIKLKKDSIGDFEIEDIIDIQKSYIYDHINKQIGF